MIRVHVDPGWFHAQKHDVLIGVKVVKALKLAGIPVTASNFVIQGIAHGKLEYYMEGPIYVYDWRENEQDASKSGLERTYARDGVTVWKNGDHLEDDEL